MNNKYIVNKLLAEILFSTLRTTRQHLCLIENGIGSVVSKCEQAAKNIVFLESELLGELHQINKLQKTKKPALREIIFTNAIATWSASPDYVQDILKKNDINFGIVINQAPKLSGDYKINLSSYILATLRRQEFSGERIDKVKKELSITETGLLDLEATYELITQNKVGNVNFRRRDIVGKIAEAYMQYFISNLVYTAGKKIRFNHSYETKGKEIRLNNTRMTYKTPAEMDFILTYKRDFDMYRLKSLLEQQEQIHIVENQKADENIIQYVSRGTHSKRK